MIEFACPRDLATRIPGARLVALESDNHITLADEPAWPMFVDEVSAFPTAFPDPASCAR